MPFRGWFHSHSNLKNLALRSIRGLSPNAFKNISWLRKLTSIDLIYTPATDEFVEHLMNCCLKNLNLGFTKVTDRSLEILGEMDTLEFLNLSGTTITDLSLKFLKPLYQKWLDIAASCNTLNNHSTVFQIAASLNSSYINRLSSFHVNMSIYVHI